jgi:hypothetical protein
MVPAVLQVVAAVVPVGSINQWGVVVVPDPPVKIAPVKRTAGVLKPDAAVEVNPPSVRLPSALLALFLKLQTPSAEAKNLPFVAIPIPEPCEAKRLPPLVTVPV